MGAVDSPEKTEKFESPELNLFDAEIDLKFKLRHVEPSYSQQVMEQVGFDETYLTVAHRKFKHQLIYADNVRSPGANILKQTCLSIGAEAATHKQTITCKVDEAPVLISATQGQLDQIQKKLRPQPFGLQALSQSIHRLQKRQANLAKFPISLWAILNITPDSFSDGGLFLDEKKCLEQIESWVESGFVDVVDIGGESTRPGAKEVSSKEEMKRVLPVIELIKKQFPQLKISLDTRKADVAQAGLDLGVEIINDVSGLQFDPKMLSVISQYACQYVLMHSQNTPEVMQENPQYSDVIGELSAFFYQQIAKCLQAGIPFDNILVDPGFGFGKTSEHNIEILNRLSELTSLGFPMLVGVSRKSFLQGQNDNIPVDQREYLTTAAITQAFQAGAKCFRVHDIKAQGPVINWLKQQVN